MYHGSCFPFHQPHPSSPNNKENGRLLLILGQINSNQKFAQADPGPVQVHAAIGSVFAVTAAIEYARTGRFNSLDPKYSTNTALTLSALALVAGISNFARTGSAISIMAGLAFCALYLISFIRLQTVQRYGNEIALLASILLGSGFLPRVVNIVGRPLPREFCLLGIYGTAMFANAIHFWLGLAFSLSLRF
jgi:uncharacterized membrane protein (UPF0136 family)